MKQIVLSEINDLEMWRYIKIYENKAQCKELLASIGIIDPSEIKNRSEIINYSIKQSYEFYQASKNVSNLTSPLLSYYSMLNLGKALYYLKSPEIDSRSFSSHGATIKDAINNDFLEIEIKIKSGGIKSISSIFNDNALPDKLTIEQILSQIVEIAQLFELSYGTFSSIKRTNFSNNKYTVLAPISTLDNLKHVIEGHRLVSDVIDDTKLLIQETVATHEKYPGWKEKIVVKNSTGEIFTRVPLKIDGTFYYLHQPTLVLLLTFAYGMLARYNANRWGTFNNSLDSKDAAIIASSIELAQSRYLFESLQVLYDVKFNSLMDTIRTVENKISYVFEAYKYNFKG
jgi:hypothetical protein